MPSRLHETLGSTISTRVWKLVIKEMAATWGAFYFMYRQPHVHPGFTVVEWKGPQYGLSSILIICVKKGQSVLCNRSVFRGDQILNKKSRTYGTSDQSISFAKWLDPLPIHSLINPVMSPLMDPEMSPLTDPEMSPLTDPEMSPLMDPEMSPIMDPVMSPLMDPEMSPFMDPVMSPFMVPEMSPFMDPEMSPSWSTPNLLPIRSLEDPWWGSLKDPSRGSLEEPSWGSFQEPSGSRSGVDWEWIQSFSKDLIADRLIRCAISPWLLVFFF